MGRAAGPLTFGDDMDGLRARVKLLETKLADFDQMAARLAVVERDVTTWKEGGSPEAVEEVKRLIDEEKEERHKAVTALKLETSQKVLVARTGAVAELAELDRKVQELDQGLRHLDQCVVTCSQGFQKFEKEQRQKVTHLQVNIGEQIREMNGRVDVCAPRNEIKMAMKGIQFDMLNHSNACRCLARAVSDMKKNLDLKGDADDALEQILRWETAVREPEKRTVKTTSSPSGTSSADPGKDQSDRAPSPPNDAAGGSVQLAAKRLEEAVSKSSMPDDPPPLAQVLGAAVQDPIGPPPPPAPPPPAPAQPPPSPPPGPPGPPPDGRPTP